MRGGAASALPNTAEAPNGEDVARDVYRLRLAGREWAVRHAGDVLTFGQEQRYLGEGNERPAYGVVLWPSAIALAHEVAGRAAGRADAFRGRRVLEVGAGTGLPGIVAASFGARVTQTDRLELALDVCRANGRRNGVAVDCRLADWTRWDDAARYHWIVGADVLYSDAAREHLPRIFATNLAPGGRVLVADPFRSAAVRLLEAMEADGWSVALTTWRIDVPGSGEEARPFGVFELAPPGAGR